MSHTRIASFQDAVDDYHAGLPQRQALKFENKMVLVDATKVLTGCGVHAVHEPALRILRFSGASCLKANQPKR